MFPRPPIIIYFLNDTKKIFFNFLETNFLILKVY